MRTVMAAVQRPDTGRFGRRHATGADLPGWGSLAEFWPLMQLGAIFTAVTVARYFGQTVYAVVRAGRRAAEGEVVPTTGGRT